MTVKQIGMEEEGLPKKDNSGEERPDSKFKKGIELYQARKWSEALEAFLSQVHGDYNAEDKMELAYYLGLCYTKLGKYEDARAFLEKIVSDGADVLRVYQCRMTLAYIYVITKRVKLAEFELNRLRHSGLESPLLYNTLAYAAWSQKKYRNAVEFYEKTLDIDSNNATAMNSMGFILADTGMDVMRGLRLCRKAVDLKSQNPAYLDSLGWAYYKSGEVVEARTWLRRALELSPDEKEIQRHFKIVTGEKI